MFSDIDISACQDLAVPAQIMRHVVRVESSFNPYAIGVVGGRLMRQPRNAAEAVATAQMLESKGYNFSLGLAQVNRYNLAKYGLPNYRRAFEVCPNLQAGAQILAECFGRSRGDWGKSFSCYYSGNFDTGFRHGYVRKVFASMQSEGGSAPAIPLAGEKKPRASVVDRRSAPPMSRIEPPAPTPSAAPAMPAQPYVVAAPPAGHAPTSSAPAPETDRAFVF